MNWNKGFGSYNRVLSLSAITDLFLSIKDGCFDKSQFFNVALKQIVKYYVNSTLILVDMYRVIDAVGILFL